VIAEALAPPVNRTRDTEFELKFTLPAALAPTVEAGLRAICRPHPEFHEAIISSVYYDWADWRLLNEKTGSDFLKMKVRVRWYRPVQSDGPGDTPAFAEAKLKTGSQREKVRIALPEPASHWARTALNSPDFQEPLLALRGQGFTEFGRLRPAFQIDYHRLRFVHPFSAHVLCLDTRIRVPRVHHGRLRHPAEAPLPLAVMEQKGPLDHLDPVFDLLTRFPLRKGAFSKYQHCFSHLTGIFP